jgi:hypothetical protein
MSPWQQKCAVTLGQVARRSRPRGQSVLKQTASLVPTSRLEGPSEEEAIAYLQRQEMPYGVRFFDIQMFLV